MYSDAATVDEYLESLDEPRRTEVERTLEAVRPHLPEGLDEGMDFGMITWSVPLAVQPDTYNGKPLMFAALASQKQYISLYLMSLYSGTPLDEETFRSRWNGAKKLNMGKSCVRFRTVDDLDVPLIQEVLDEASIESFVGAYNTARGNRRSG